jgi:hypothetical protein
VYVLLNVSFLDADRQYCILLCRDHRYEYLAVEMTRVLYSKRGSSATGTQDLVAYCGLQSEVSLTKVSVKKLCVYFC